MSSRTQRIRRLDVGNHDRDAAGMRYVYPVVSRRSGGVSVGINLNPNNACNWRCIYCQVPNLVRGKGPRIDLALLESELAELLDDIVFGDFLERSAPSGARRLSDIAFSGNGEPTTSPDLEAALAVVARALDRFELRGKIRLVLITNGSMVDRPAVARALARLAELGGEAWFKLDSATREGSVAINAHRVSPERHLEKLVRCAELCPTFVQTCFFGRNGVAPSEMERHAYLAALDELRERAVPLRGVMLYSLARPSLQPEAAELAPLSKAWLDELANEIRARGFAVESY